MLVSAGLVGGSFLRLMRTDLGFAPEQVLTASLALPDDRYDYEQSADLFRQLVPRLAALPGVRAAGAVNVAPFLGWQTGMDYVPGTRLPAEPREWRSAGWRAVTPGYFAALQIPLRRGRLLDSTDVYPAPEAMLVNETMARLAWPDGDPVGQQVTLANTRTMTVVGVVADTRQMALDSVPGPTMYFAHAQLPWKSMWLMVRTTGDPVAALDAVRREVHAIDPRLPLARVGPLTRLVDDAAAEPRLTTLVFAIFATAALTLAAIGLFGLVSYTVSQRTRELGVRLALGAAPGQVAGAVVRHGVRLAALGVVLGAAAALAAGRVLETILYETRPTDVATYAGVAALLLAVAAAASAGPARRAARLDPASTLRAE
jgi:predicted permease